MPVNRDHSPRRNIRTIIDELNTQFGVYLPASARVDRAFASVVMDAVFALAEEAFRLDPSVAGVLGTRGGIRSVDAPVDDPYMLAHYLALNIAEITVWATMPPLSPGTRRFDPHFTSHFIRTAAKALDGLATKIDPSGGVVDGDAPEPLAAPEPPVSLLKIAVYLLSERLSKCFMPEGAQVVGFDNAGDQVWLLAIVDDQRPLVPRWFVHLSVNELFPADARHVGLCKINDQVRHIVEMPYHSE